jgi:hypothetical protein
LTDSALTVKEKLASAWRLTGNLSLAAGLIDFSLEKAQADRELNLDADKKHISIEVCHENAPNATRSPGLNIPRELLAVDIWVRHKDKPQGLYELDLCVKEVQELLLINQRSLTGIPCIEYVDTDYQHREFDQSIARARVLFRTTTFQG